MPAAYRVLAIGTRLPEYPLSPVAYSCSCSTRWVSENIQVSIEYPGTQRVPDKLPDRVPG